MIKQATTTSQEKEHRASDPSLCRALEQIEKTFGKGAIMHLDAMQAAAVDGISTGILSLDLAMGGAGAPRGRILEFFGPESSGKTTLALCVAASAQAQGGVAAFIDAEHALDPTWSKKCGIDLQNLLVSQPNSGEEALQIAEMLIRSNAVDVIVVDSVAAMIPKAEIDGEIGDTQVALQARLMSQAMRKLTAAIAKSRCVVIFINQLRMKIGVMFGNPETTPGGKALKFYSSVRLDIRRTGSIKEGEVVTGNRTKAKVVKNKVAAPFREAEFDIMFDSGVSAEGDLLDMACADKIVDKSGTWFSYKDVRLGQGRENAKAYLKDNPDLFREVRAAIVAKRLPPAPAVQGTTTAGSARLEKEASDLAAKSANGPARPQVAVKPVSKATEGAAKLDGAAKVAVKSKSR